MSEPGWYPDPAGTPGQRYFDGSEWATTVRRAPAVGDDAGAYATRRRRLPGPLRMLLTVLATLLALGALGGLSAWAVTRKAPEKPAPETFTPSVRPTSTKTPDKCRGVHDHNPTTTPSTPGRLAAGGVSVPRLDGWQPSTRVPALSDSMLLTKRPQPRWDSYYGVATLRHDRFGTTAEAAAKALQACLAGSWYSDLPTTAVFSRAERLGGREGYHVRAEYRSKDPALKGSRLDILTLDTGLGDRFAVVLLDAYQEPEHLAEADRILADVRVG